MNYRIKYIVAAVIGGALIKASCYFPAEDIVTFAAGWFLLLQVAFIVYMGTGLRNYVAERRERTS